ncbi:MAG: hypothetical protein CVU05_04005 [Bacteroidetes bacterium HGW-Bacteroidetes-21]|jgi:hypothetical protein|nr:MAG: hypothetical protein CVU05_04005 [Bacteroidetes bacterium HGW-Bacteroidetes-21]
MYKLFWLLCFVFVLSHLGFGQFNTPDYYSVSFAEKKALLISNFKFVAPEKVELKNDLCEVRKTENGIVFENLTDSSNMWGYPNVRIGAEEYWEIETVVRTVKSCRFYLRFNGDTSKNRYNMAAFDYGENNYSLSAVQNSDSNLVQYEVYFKQYLRQKDSLFTINIRRNKYSMSLFVNQKFVGNFPPEFKQINGNDLFFVLQDKSAIEIMSLKVYSISYSNQKDFVEKYKDARADGIDASRKQLVFSDDFNDNKNEWKQIGYGGKYLYYGFAKISGGFIKTEEYGAVKAGIMDFNQDFEVELMVNIRNGNFQNFIIGCDSDGYSCGIDAGLWADRRYKTYNPPRHFIFKFDTYQKYEGGYWTHQPDAVKMIIRKVGDVLYFFGDDQLIAAMTPCQKFKDSIRFYQDGKFDYIKVYKIN